MVSMIAIAIVVIAVIAIAGYFLTSGKYQVPGGTIDTGGTGGTSGPFGGAGASAEDIAANALNSELNAQTQNISSSNIENLITAP